ncbi:bifunctional N-acetylglucosamine-1-phosphate-uridyltransferase/glucosamine-1-phosphate-acetyltransferase GlmU-like protein [Pseudomonas rhodesiae]|nr:bifunctional N-acetylglucosamine-1-phosphate-uridyltransferase/glucosamine-1-phosphate-acetyltransferase GlmU-like protein [Pseudomonas rhodesiae]
MSLEIVILAAGQGTRMRSALPKVLHPVAGNSMLGHVIHSARQLDPQRIHVVIGHGADVVRERLAADDLNFVLQDKQLGTGHATAQAVPFITADTRADPLRRRAADRSANPATPAKTCGTRPDGPAHR